MFRCTYLQISSWYALCYAGREEQREIVQAGSLSAPNPFLTALKFSCQLLIPGGCQHLLSPSCTEIHHVSSNQFPAQVKSRRPAVQTAHLQSAPLPKATPALSDPPKRRANTRSIPQPEYSYPPPSHLLTATQHPYDRKTASWLRDELHPHAGDRPKTVYSRSPFAPCSFLLAHLAQNTTGCFVLFLVKSRQRQLPLPSSILTAPAG